MSGCPGMIAPTGHVVRPDEDDGIAPPLETVTTEVRRVGRNDRTRRAKAGCQDGRRMDGPTARRAIDSYQISNTRS